jgi:hypothetical protein
MRQDVHCAAAAAAVIWTPCNASYHAKATNLSIPKPIRLACSPSHRGRLVGALQDVSAGDSEARTPLHYAAGYNHAEIAMMLLEAGANLEARDTKVGQLFLHALKPVKGTCIKSHLGRDLCLVC